MKTLPEGAPKQEIIVDSQKLFWDIKPIFSSPDNAYSHYDWDDWLYAVKYNGTTPSNGEIASGEFSLEWKDIAHDSDGRKITMKLTGYNLRGYGNTDPTVLGIYTNGMINARTLGLENPNGCYTWFDIRWDFFYGDTGETAPGQWAIEFNDLDTWSRFNNEDWFETVQLQKNFGDIYVIPDDMCIAESTRPSEPGCWLNFYKSTNGYVSCQANRDYLYDENTLCTGFMVGVTSGFQMSWWGAKGCATMINKMYGQSKITASRDEGGNITDEGTVEVAWKNDKTYTATADKHHVISRIIVDGKDIPVTNPKEQSYTFQEVISDHTIHVSFTNIQHALIYDANTSSDDGYTGETPSTIHDAGTNAPISDNGFVRAGYRFIGWNTEPDGSGESYFPEDEIFIDDRDITLYAQWEKLVTVTFKDEDGTIYTVDDNVPIGGNSTPPIAPTRAGYTFAGWTGTYTDVQKDEVVIASWTPNKYTVIYEPNGGEGEHMPVQQMRYDEDETISESSYTRHNYEFIGWNTSPDGTGTSYTPGKIFKNLTEEPDGKVHLYAQWEFYIQMPDTGEIGVEVLAITGLGMVSVAFASVMISRRQRRRADGAETSQRRPASSALWDSCKNHIDSH